MGEMCDFEAEFYPENWTTPNQVKPRMNTSKLVGLREWAARVFEKPPHYNTLLNWVHNGNISPKPKKMGKQYYVKPNAEYQG